MAVAEVGRVDSQRTHKPTPKRVREFRKRGEIALSRDVVSAATFAGGAIALVACGATAFGAMRSFARDTALAADGLPTGDLAGAMTRVFLAAAVPVVIGAALGALAAIFGQLGWPPATKKLGFDLARISPMKNLRNVLSPAAMARRGGAATVKLAAVGAVVVVAVGGAATTRVSSVGAIAGVASTAITRALYFVIATLVAIGAVDYVLARRRIHAQMRMTPDELKREMREQEGDPHIKGKRRAKMKELAKRRIQAAVAKADVVVVNPTHYAVALRYDDKTDAAPIVVAKGTDEVAEKIREVARKHGVPVLSRPPLARALHKLVKEGKPVPAKLYRAVAEVLAYVYRIRRGNA